VALHQRGEGRLVTPGEEALEELAVGGLFEGAPQLAEDPAQPARRHGIRPQAVENVPT
jgi:hypothetical protein